MAERRTVLFSGSVQGVGFRYTACRAADGRGVTGYVRNLPDGRVECVAEGGRDEVNTFFADLSDRMRAYIRGREQDTSAATGEFSSFGVRF